MMISPIIRACNIWLINADEAPLITAVIAGIPAPGDRCRGRGRCIGNAR